jgi:hypothetical protein
MAKHRIFRFRAELANYEPQIWRTFEINGERTVAELIYTIMIMFEMQGQHLVSLVQDSEAVLKNSLMKQGYSKELIEQVLGRAFVKNEHYEFLIDDVYVRDNEVLIDPRDVKVQSRITEIGTTFKLIYDYGDGWEINLVLEDFQTEEISLTKLPRVLEGEGFGIIEDIGGVTGLERLAEALKTGKTSEERFILENLEIDNLDLNLFDLKRVNLRLKKEVRFYRYAYEQDI